MFKTYFKTLPMNNWKETIKSLKPTSKRCQWITERKELITYFKTMSMKSRKKGKITNVNLVLFTWVFVRYFMISLYAWSRRTFSEIFSGSRQATAMLPRFENMIKYKVDVVLSNHSYIKGGMLESQRRQ